eukprot:TRINITY_DN5113_c0_g1_i1.p1 TRINITY_DN5113_c0_g1~~TRINITY_DN5113_c0_g1_i1.p1  ORF type:complete len:432 (+),score=77.67 TRINITY_DN5113_c0_g1_i1:1923-3218(+)
MALSLEGISFISAREEELNNNNIQDTSEYPYSFTDLTNGEPFIRPTKVTPGNAVCDFCFVLFPTYAALFKHKARPCYIENEKQGIVYPIKITFNKPQLFYIEDAINSLKIPVEQDGDKLSIVVDKSMLEITLRRFYFCQITKYNLEEWYPSIEKLVQDSKLPAISIAKSLFFALSEDDLNLMKGLASVVLASNFGLFSREKQEELAGRENLENRITHFAFQQPAEYFCKFSTRSPKDSVAIVKEDKEEGVKVEEKLKKKFQSLKVTNATQVVDLLTHSQRIFSDIGLYFQYRVPGSSFGNINIIFREWIAEMPFDHEFRCFVHNKTITAISQYDCYHRFEALQDVNHVARIREVIFAFHENIKVAIKVPSYILDVAVFPSNYTCHLIELNPFGSYMSSGASLFDWRKDEALLYGKEPHALPPIRILDHIIV